jgi:hypothetical protein
MRDLNPAPRVFRPVLIVALALAAGTGLARAADDKKPAEEPRVPVAECLTVTGSMIARPKPDQPWQVIKEKGTLHTGDLIIGLHGARLETKKGGIRLGMLSDPDHTAPFPVLESAIILHDNPEADLDVTLDRGRIDVTNLKKDPARVRIRLRNHFWGLELAPGARVAAECYGRWPRGVPFRKQPRPGEEPTLDAVLLVLKGEAELRSALCEFDLTAPPGPALFQWDSVVGCDPAPTTLKELPRWADAEQVMTPEGKAVRAVMERFRAIMIDRGIGAALDQFIQSDDPLQRRAAVIAMAATDDLKRIGQALLESKHPDIWDNVILAMRHWIGRAPGQDQKLYQAIVANGRASAGEAEIMLQLLHTPGDDLLAVPELYEVLIEYLQHDKPMIRALAHWHLCRNVYDGRKIPFNPVGSKEELRKAYDAWKKLVPTGELPKKPKLEDVQPDKDKGEKP